MGDWPSLLWFCKLDRNPKGVHIGHHQGTNHVVVPFYLSAVGTNVTSTRMGLRYTIPPTLMVNDSVSEYPIYFMTNSKNFFSSSNLLVTANIQLAQLGHICMWLVHKDVRMNIGLFSKGKMKSSRMRMDNGQQCTLATQSCVLANPYFT